MLKIGFLARSLSSEDGWGRYSKSLVEAVSRHDQVRVLVSRNTPNESPLSHVYQCLPDCSWGLVAQIKIFLYTLRYLRGCQVIHSLIEMHAPGAALASRLLGARFVMTLHGTYAVPPANFSLRRWLLLFAYRTASITTTGSPYTEKKAREQVSFGECRFIPNGVDDKIFRVIIDLKKDDFLLTVGALKPRKGADVVIRALSLLQKDFPNLRYKIVGRADSPAFLDHLKNLAMELQVADKIDFLSGISDDYLVKLYNQSKIFILAARDVDGSFEGFPMVFYEANACGTPVISTAGFGSEYAIKNGRNGYVVMPDSPELVAGAVRKILSQEQFYNQLRQGAIEEANNHTWDKVALQLTKMYQDTLAI